MIENIKKKKIISVITLIVLFQESLIYLVTFNTINLLSIIGLFLFLVNGKNIFKRHYEFKTLVLSFILIQLFGIILSNIYYGQGIFQGIYGAHYIFIYGWYFYLVDLMRINCSKPYNEYAEYTKNYLVKLGLIIVSVVILQGALYDKVVFLNLKYALRNGLRISGCYIATPIFIFLLADIFKKFNLKRLIAICIVSYYLIKFNQSRSLIIVLLISMIILYLRNLITKNFKFGIKDLFIIYIGIIILIATYKYWSSMIGEMLNEMSSVKNTGGVRIREMQYYYELLKERHFWGIGILAYEFPLTEIIHGTAQYYYYLEDVGMFSMLFQTGILGVIWLIAFLVKFFRVIRAHKKDYWSFVGYINLYRIIFGFLTIQIFNNKYSLVYFIIILAMMEIKVNKKIDLHKKG